MQQLVGCRGNSRRVQHLLWAGAARGLARWRECDWPGLPAWRGKLLWRRQLHRRALLRAWLRWAALVTWRQSRQRMALLLQLHLLAVWLLLQLLAKLPMHRALHALLRRRQRKRHLLLLVRRGRRLPLLLLLLLMHAWGTRQLLRLLQAWRSGRRGLVRPWLLGLVLLLL